MTTESKQTIPKLTIIGMASVIAGIDNELEKFRAYMSTFHIPSGCESTIPSEKGGCHVSLVIDRIYNGKNEGDVLKDPENEHDVLDDDLKEEELYYYPVVFARNATKISRLRAKDLYREHSDKTGDVGMVEYIEPYFLDIFWNESDSEEDKRRDPFEKVLPEIQRIMKERGW